MVTQKVQNTQNTQEAQENKTQQSCSILKEGVILDCTHYEVIDPLTMIGTCLKCAREKQYPKCVIYNYKIVLPQYAMQWNDGFYDEERRDLWLGR